MVKRKNAPARGEIWHINGDPQAGSELKGAHYYLVVTPEAMNATFRNAICAPITSGGERARVEGLTVTLDGSSTDTGKITGVILPFLRSFDLVARGATYAATVEPHVMDEFTSIIIDIIDPQ